MRCDEVIVQLVVRTYDKDGAPIREQTSQPVKVFRNAHTHDFWAEVDKAVNAMPSEAPMSTDGEPGTE